MTPDTEPQIISIITPTYNQGKYIAKCIESVLSQAGNFLIDYIILDGGSEDETVGEIRKYEDLLKQNCKVQERAGLSYYICEKPEFGFNHCLGISYRWQSKQDKGQSDAINQGFDLAKGTVLTWLNSDDYFTENALANVQKSFQSSDVDVVTGNTIALNEAGEALWLQRTGKPSLYSILYCREAPPQPATFFTREILDKVGGRVDEGLRYTMDTDLWIRMCFADAKFLKTHDFLAVQVYQTNSKSLEGDKMFEAFEPENELIRKRYKARLGTLTKLQYNLRLLFFHKPFAFIFNYGYAVPRPVKDILNKVIAYIKSR